MPQGRITNQEKVVLKAFGLSTAYNGPPWRRPSNFYYNLHQEVDDLRTFLDGKLVYTLLKKLVGRGYLHVLKNGARTTFVLTTSGRQYFEKIMAASNLKKTRAMESDTNIPIAATSTSSAMAAIG